MSKITVDLGAALTGDTFTIGFRWIDRNGIMYTDKITASNYADDLVIVFDDDEVLRVAGTDENRESIK